METNLKPKRIFYRVILTAFVLALCIFLFKDSFAEKNRNATCPRTVTFCVAGAGSGTQINIYRSGDCSSNYVTTIITGSNGCADYTFTNYCDSTHSANTTCLGKPNCSYFVPNNTETATVFPCSP